MSESRLRARVDAGIALLDEKFPGWQDVIKVDSLNLQNAQHCVLGQLDRAGAMGSTRKTGYWSALDVLGMEFKDSVEFGFAMEAGKDHRYARLTAEWVDRIESRKRGLPEAAQVSFWLGQAAGTYAKGDREGAVTELKRVLEMIK